MNVGPNSGIRNGSRLQGRLVVALGVLLAGVALWQGGGIAEASNRLAVDTRAWIYR